MEIDMDVTFAPAAAEPTQTVTRLPCGLRLSMGANLGVAEMIVAETCDLFVAPFRTVGLVDDDNQSFAAVFCRPAPRLDLILMSAVTGGLPFSPTVIRTIVRIAFGEMSATRLLITADATDAGKRETLLRLGFETYDVRSERLVLFLCREDLRPCLRRLVAGYMH